MTINPHPKPARKQKSPPRPLGRSEKPIRRSAIKPKNAKRRKSEFARCYHSKERVCWIQDQPCISGGTHFGPVQNAHIETDGISRKAGYRKIVPLCWSHHHELHSVGSGLFEIAHSLDLDKAAAETEAKWQAWLRVSGTPE